MNLAEQHIFFRAFIKIFWIKLFQSEVFEENLAGEDNFISGFFAWDCNNLEFNILLLCAVYCQQTRETEHLFPVIFILILFCTLPFRQSEWRGSRQTQRDRQKKSKKKGKDSLR